MNWSSSQPSQPKFRTSGLLQGYITLCANLKCFTLCQSIYILPGGRRTVGNGYERRLGWGIHPHHVSPNRACYPANTASHWSLICCLWLANVTHLMSNTKSSQSPSFYWFGLKCLEMHFLILWKQQQTRTHPEQVWGGLCSWKSRNENKSEARDQPE